MFLSVVEISAAPITGKMKYAPRRLIDHSRYLYLFHLNLYFQVEVDLGPRYRYHSRFACPILRQQCTDSNPPVRLSCGHVISRDALTKLTNGNKYAPNNTNNCQLLDEVEQNIVICQSRADQ